MGHISIGGKSLSAIALYAKVARPTAQPSAAVKNHNLILRSAHPKSGLPDFGT
jgi:hypothetical protein